MGEVSNRQINDGGEMRQRPAEVETRRSSDIIRNDAILGHLSLDHRLPLPIRLVYFPGVVQYSILPVV